MTTTKTIKVTLSERRPVNINPELWPVIASAKTFWGGNGVWCQASEEAWIKVRQHDDGRTLVYCDRDRGNGGMPAGYRGVAGGYLLDSSDSDEIVRAIRRCGGIIGAPELADECIADLPAEEI